MAIRAKTARRGRRYSTFWAGLLLLVLLAIFYALLAWTSAARAQSAVKSAPACKQVKAETDLIGIRLGDEKTAKKIIGDTMDPKSGLKTEDEKDADGATGFPFVRLSNRDGTEEARLFIHYGDIVNSYNEMEVVPSKDAKGKRMTVAQFSTERGVKLGMGERALTSLLGSCFSRGTVTADNLDDDGTADRSLIGGTTIKYVIDDANHALLKRTNMPSYRAVYTFKDGKLARIFFGLDYP